MCGGGGGGGAVSFKIRHFSLCTMSMKNAGDPATDSGLMRELKLRWTAWSNTAIKLEKHCFVRLNGFPDIKRNSKMNNNGSDWCNNLGH